MREVLKKQARKIRFAIVGALNTTLDLATFFILTLLIPLPKEFLNVISTSISFIFSFFANKKFTFKSDSKHTKEQFVYFTAITLFGLWVIQGVIIFLLTPVINSLLANKSLSLLVAKLIATIATLIWNYILYSRVVFQTPTNSSD
ncbi:MAG: GtrA family protein [Candidatus Saccharibacteria bacterium]|nr:GtrA family protein [Candidatus Saccharibacteria bacterium]